GVYIKAMEVCQYNSDIVFAGYYAQDSTKGGVFYSMDAGSNWNQLLIEASTVGQDVDVRDIIFNIEGLDTVAYIGVEYDLAHPQGKSVYRAVKNGLVWTVAQNFDAANTTVGYQITATINDLYRSATGDTLYACGTDAGLNEPHVYSKSISGTNKWDAITVVGFPYSTGTVGKAITVGHDTAYCAVDNEIYYFPLNDSSWTLGYSYPIGNEINFLYFDELLVGAGTGLYKQSINGNLVSVIEKNKKGIINNILFYPNPIKNTATISYTIYSNEHILLSLYDVTGREIKTIVNENKAPGAYKININTEQLAKGIYIVKLISGKEVSFQEVVIE
ncbi:MAG: T9SS type A sorting domain-containing protein, partial [Bacteroidetes bacterium]|nr:T9SS type A sorting domain-containing protein [Bacteroidota bacterium]